MGGEYRMFNYNSLYRLNNTRNLQDVYALHRKLNRLDVQKDNIDTAYSIKNPIGKKIFNNVSDNMFGKIKTYSGDCSGLKIMIENLVKNEQPYIPQMYQDEVEYDENNDFSIK